MDDRTFDQATAQDWINTVESKDASKREDYLYPLLREWAKQVSPKEILEIGCGQGACSPPVSLAGWNYTGAEPSKFLLERAKELYANERRRFVEGNAYELPLADASYDAVFSVLVWQLLGDLNLAAREMGRVLKPNSPFLIVTWNPDSYDELIGMFQNTESDGRRFEGDLIRPDKSKSHDVLYLHTLEEIQASLAINGLSIERSETLRKTQVSPQGLYLAIFGRSGAGQ
jgi:SAM-dependent methyltransferase